MDRNDQFVIEQIKNVLKARYQGAETSKIAFLCDLRLLVVINPEILMNLMKESPSQSSLSKYLKKKYFPRYMCSNSM